MKLLNNFKQGLIHGTGIITILAIAGISYAAFNDTISEVTTGSNLQASEYNKLVQKLNAIDEKQLATAWVNFNGNDCPSNICSINDQFNVSSVTKLATGQFRIFFSNNMDNTNYSVSINSSYSPTGVTTAKSATQWSDMSTDYSTNLDSVWVGVAANNSSVYYTSAGVSVQVFGGKN